MKRARGPVTAAAVAWAAVCAIMAAPAAPASEFRVEGGLWDYRVSGFQDDHGKITDLESFAPGRQRDGFLQLEFEHRPSWLPDLAASYAQVSGAGSQTTTTGPALPLPLPGSTTTTTASGNFRDLDVTARYAIAVGPLRLAPGITVKSLRGHIQTSDSSSGSQSDRSYSNVFPMLHGQITWLLGDYLRLAAQGDWIKGGDNQAYQYSASAELRILGPLGLYGGWQERRYKVSNGGSSLDARLRGPRYGLIVVF